MSWIAVGAGVVAVGASAYGTYASTGKKNKANRFELAYQEDPFYKKSQESLSNMGEGLMSGNIPEYYKGIGETGGSEIEKMLGLITRDTTKSVDESLARRNISRGGIAGSLTAKTVADQTTKLRWSDFQRAMAGKQFLLGTGINTVEGVRESGQREEQMKNEFAMQGAGINYQADLYNKQLAAKKSAMWATALEAGVGTFSSLYGMGGATPKASGSAAPVGAGPNATYGMGQAPSLNTIKRPNTMSYV